MRVPVTSSSQAINTHYDPRTLAGRTPSSQGAKNGLGWGVAISPPSHLVEGAGAKGQDSLEGREAE